MEHEIIPMTTQSQHDVQNCMPAVPQTSAERRRDVFQRITPMSPTLFVKQHKHYTLHRAVTDRQPVILRVLKGTFAIESHSLLWHMFYRETQKI